MPGLCSSWVRGRLLGALAGTAGVRAGLTGSAAAATAPAYVTPLMAHTAWTATENCAPVAGVVTLPTVLSGHSSRGYRLTGTVVTDWVRASTRNCIENLAVKPFPKPIQLPSWAVIASLRTTYPWFDLASASLSNEPSYVVKNMTIRQVEALWGIS